MARPDLNLLITLDVLLSEGSVVRAAKRLGLSPSAMSRALARLRSATGDPLLVRAGRGLVATPRAQELRDRVGPLVEGAEALLRPTGQFDLTRLVRTFAVRTSDGFVENFGPEIISRIGGVAPGVRLHFTQKPDKDATALREGQVDLETGVVGKSTSPELHAQALFRDRLVGVVRKGHALARGKVTVARFVAGRHVAVSRRIPDVGLIDLALEPLGVAREIVAMVGGYSAALSLARGSDLIATVPETHTGNLRTGMHTFALPVAVPGITVSMLWHPRLDADPAHRWLRGLFRSTCAASR